MCVPFVCIDLHLCSLLSTFLFAMLKLNMHISVTLQNKTTWFVTTWLFIYNEQDWNVTILMARCNVDVQNHSYLCHLEKSQCSLWISLNMWWEGSVTRHLVTILLCVGKCAPASQVAVSSMEWEFYAVSRSARKRFSWRKDHRRLFSGAGAH